MENEEIGRTVAVGQADITSMLCNLLKQQSALDVDLDSFDRNLLELAEKRIDDPRGRLTRLIRYTKCDPKDMIQLVTKMLRKVWTRSMETLTKIWMFIGKR